MTTSPRAASPVRTRVLLILVMQCLVVLLCVVSTTLVAVAVQERSIRAATAERVLDVSESLAGLDQVRRAVQSGTAEAMTELQPLADIIQEASGVDYVVITDADGIRLTHPTPGERGEPVSTDPAEVLAGEVFVGTETGTIGETLRAKVPVYDGDRVVGTASVGILESEMSADFETALAGLLPWVLASIVIGCLVSAALTGFLRRRVRRLEDRARDLETQRRIADALRDQTHEFRTRLHVIRGLIAEGEAAAALDYVDRIAPVTKGVDAAADVADPALRALLESHAADFAAVAGDFAVDPLTTVPRDALSDSDLVIAANLCRNAVEAAGPGGRVRVLVTVEGARVRIEVDDDGPGVPDAAVDRIFERGVSTKGGGDERGVGLDIVRREVGSRGGTITVGRSPWGGARFAVDAPIAAPGLVR